MDSPVFAFLPLCAQGYNHGWTKLQAQVRAELQGIVAVLQELTGLPSRWSGLVELVPGAEFKGKKRFSCDIQIDAALAEQDVRWSTLIHEAFHTIPAGYHGTDYCEFPGWEEGVVERLQRLYRPTVLSRLGVSICEDVFRTAELQHNYSKYIEALERIRLFLVLTDEVFYSNLLKTPIKERYGSVFALGNRLAGPQRVAFFQILSSAGAILKDF